MNSIEDDGLYYDMDAATVKRNIDAMIRDSNQKVWFEDLDSLSPTEENSMLECIGEMREI